MRRWKSCWPRDLRRRDHCLADWAALRTGQGAIAQGLHVHFNKTMTTTVDEADDLIALRPNRRASSWSPAQARCCARSFNAVATDPRRALGQLTWAVTGAAFGTYHENERVRGGNDPLSNINPAWYFRRARRRPALRHDRLWHAHAHRHPWPG